jgi:(1->4)-alpha-D-glucan 1-alpha-D-glucosylmutase
MPEDSLPEKRIKESIRKLRPRVPVSTYRLQLSGEFMFTDAAAVLQYLETLGITDLYTSPYFMAKKGSMHGYDITDPGQINPELGGEDGFETLTAGLEKRGMGLISDIVPNHMGIDSPRNSWWLDVMENGPSSAYAKYFDIDWSPVREALENKVVIPILGDQYGTILESGDICLTYYNGGLFINYWENRFPLDPSTYDMVLAYKLEDLESKAGENSPEYQEALSIVTALRHLPGRNETAAARASERMREKEVIKRRIAALYDSSVEFSNHISENIRQFNGTKGSPESFDLLHCLLDTQVFRLSFWQVSTEEINYRRFFDINSLAAIRTEDKDVFESAHRLVLRHISDGRVTGLRVDHPDGLYNPGEYFRHLQRECAQSILTSGDAGLDREEAISILNAYSFNPSETPFYIIGEKILMEDESIPDDWPVCGTTGYAFMNSVGNLFVDTRNKSSITSAYNTFLGHKSNFTRTLYERKKQIMEIFMSSEINVLGNRLDIISESRRHTRDFTLNSLTDAIVETIACFPVYRTYISENRLDERDAHYIEQAITMAKMLAREITPWVFDFLNDVLTLNYPEDMDTEQKTSWLEFTMKFQQITGPIMAKGFEDTVFYCYNRLVSLNEVGGNPESFGFPVSAFHAQNSDKAKRWPHTLNTTSTHDSKRSEDARARISVISELPDEWREATRLWRRLGRPLKRRLQGLLAPDSNDEYMLYQNLLGIWPLSEGRAELESVRDRMKNYFIKALRESKTHTSWLNINAEYEEAAAAFVSGILDSEEFLSSFIPLARKIAWYGILNSLSQTILKITSPGVPDFYQGTELWNLRLVDPDNRAQVDYEHAQKTLECLKQAETRGLRNLARSLCDTMKDGRIKLFLTYRALNFRRKEKDLYMSGVYIPLQSKGRAGDSIVGFMRRLGDSSAITVAPRLLAGLVPNDNLPLGDVWEDTWLMLPEECTGQTYKDVLTGNTLEARHRNGLPALHIPDVLRNFPVALLASP